MVNISLKIYNGANATHDFFRKDKNNSGTFDKVVRGIDILRKHNIEPNILQVVTKTYLSHLKPNFKYLRDDLKLKKFGYCIFNDMEKTNPQMANESLCNEDYFFLYTTLFELWMEENEPDLIIRELDNLIFGVLGKQASTCVSSGTCTAFITIDWDGNVIPACDSLISSSTLQGHNILENKLVDILNSKERLDFTSKVNSFSETCKDCEWFFACFNGCTYHRQEAVNGRNTYCAGHKKILSYIKGRLSEIYY